jgi:hypothetical protein
MGYFAPELRQKKEVKKMSLDRPKFDAEIQITDSEWIDTIQYDPETLVLDAKLRTGQRYRYRDVNAQSFARVVTARSSGKAFNSEFRERPYKKLPMLDKRT